MSDCVATWLVMGKFLGRTDTIYSCLHTTIERLAYCDPEVNINLHYLPWMLINGKGTMLFATLMTAFESCDI